MSHPLLPLSRIRTDGGAQLRVQQDPRVVEEYAAAMRRGIIFPAVVVFDDGDDLWLADGAHRLEAARRVGRDEIPVDRRAGTRRDAVLYAAGANAGHGLRRSRADRRKAVQTLLSDPEWAKWGNREIARRCHVDHELVGRLRTELSGGNRQTDRTVQRGATVFQQKLRSAADPAPDAATGSGASPEAVPLPTTTNPGDLRRLLAGPVEPRAVYPGERLQLGRHRLYCGSPQSAAGRSDLSRAVLAIRVLSSQEEADSAPSELQELLQLADQVAVLLPHPLLPSLLRNVRAPHLRVLAVIHDGTVPRRSGPLDYWTPLLLCGPAPASRRQPDLLRDPSPPREAAGPLRPSGELLRALLEQLTGAGDAILAVDHLDELLLLAELTGRSCVAITADVRRAATAVGRWEGLTGARAVVLVR